MPGERLCYVCGVTDEVLFHNVRALVVDHDAVTRSVVFNDKLLAFAKHWDSDHGRVRRIALAPKARPRTASECEEKRRGRCFATWETFEAHLDVWTREVADIRIHGTTGEVLIARFTRAEAKALKPISGIPPFRATRELIRRVGSDCTVEIDGNAHWAIDPAYPDCRCRPHPSVNSSYRQRVDSGCRLTWDCNDCRGPLNRWRSILSSAHLLLTERHRCRTRFSAVLAAARVPLSSTIDLWNSSRGCVPTLRCEHS